MPLGAGLVSELCSFPYWAALRIAEEKGNSNLLGPTGSVVVLVTRGGSADCARLLRGAGIIPMKEEESV